VIDSLGISNWTGDSKSPVQYTSPKLENVQKNNYQIFLSSCTSRSAACAELVSVNLFFGEVIEKNKPCFGTSYFFLVTKEDR
jgi:hypothetical protein